MFTEVDGEFELVASVCMRRNDTYLLRNARFVYDFHLSDFKSCLFSNRGNNTNTASSRLQLSVSALQSTPSDYLLLLEDMCVGLSVMNPTFLLADCCQ